MIGKGAVIRGKVQGVGFRYFVKTHAESVGVIGEVWNCHNGTVQLIAYSSDEEVLADFLQHLNYGPGNVDSVQVVDAPVAAGITSFEIGPTRA